jgi:serine/threonine-protein kinase
MDVPDLPGPATQVAAGGRFTCAVAAGHAYCWGLNRDGEVGDGTQSLHPTPVLVGLPDTITAVAPGASHACALTAGGQLHCWGRNRNGETGSGMALSRAAAAPVRLGCR